MKLIHNRQSRSEIQIWLMDHSATDASFLTDIILDSCSVHVHVVVVVHGSGVVFRVGGVVVVI